MMIVLCMVGMVVCAWLNGYAASSRRIQVRIFRPWLDSLTPGEPHYWLRARDYDAAWSGYVAASGMGLLRGWLITKDGPHTFTDAPRQDAKP